MATEVTTRRRDHLIADISNDVIYPQLNKLDFNHLDLRDEHVSQIAKALKEQQIKHNHNIDTINMSANEVTGATLLELDPLPVRLSLDLRHNPISDEGFEALGKMTNLVHLDLAGVHISRENAEALAKSGSLETVNLQGAKIDNEAALEFLKNKSITYLGIMPSSIGRIIRETGETDEHGKPKYEVVRDVRSDLEAHIESNKPKTNVEITEAKGAAPGQGTSVATG